MDTTIAAGACAITSPLAVDTECMIGVEFAPAATPALTVNTTESRNSGRLAHHRSGTVTGPNSPLAIMVVGVAEALNSTTTTVMATPDPSLSART